jgi:hypothetical protein
VRSCLAGGAGSAPELVSQDVEIGFQRVIAERVEVREEYFSGQQACVCVHCSYSLAGLRPCLASALHEFIEACVIQRGQRFAGR